MAEESVSESRNRSPPQPMLGRGLGINVINIRIFILWQILMAFQFTAILAVFSIHGDLGRIFIIPCTDLLFAVFRFSYYEK